MTKAEIVEWLKKETGSRLYNHSTATAKLAADRTKIVELGDIFNTAVNNSLFKNKSILQAWGDKLYPGCFFLATKPENPDYFTLEWSGFP